VLVNLEINRTKINILYATVLMFFVAELACKSNTFLAGYKMSFSSFSVEKLAK
jgi:hypothetical protein